jgi:signal transduction histidine kinase
VSSDKETTPLTAEQETGLFRITQEALTNVARHARASAVHIRLEQQRARYELSVRDNGRGITDGEARAANAIGLLGMRERAHLIGGTFTIAGRRGKGTQLSVQVPLPGRNLPTRDRTRTARRQSR